MLKNTYQKLTAIVAVAAAPLLAQLILGGTPAFAAQQGEPLGVPVRVQAVQTSGSGGALDEFVELRNASSASVNISGWTVKACDPANGSWSALFTFPPGTTLAPGSSWRLTNAAAPFVPPGAVTYVGDIRDLGGVGVYGALGQLQDSVGFSRACSTAPAQPATGPHARNILSILSTDTNVDVVDWDVPPSL